VSQKVEQETEPVQVELDIFSGRPNPTWELTPDQSRDLARLHGSLKPASAQKTLPDGLGYRGFHLRSFQKFDETVVWTDVVQAQQRGESKQWADPGRTLEKFLLSTAGSQVDEATLEAISASGSK
jgi:hypothetical protein